MFTRKKVFGLFIRLALTIAFGFMFFRGVIRLFSNELGTKTFKEEGTFQIPSLTICPVTYSPLVDQVYFQQNRTIEDVKKLPAMMDFLDITLASNEPFSTEFNQIDLHKNLSLWTEFYRVDATFPFSLLRCAEVKIPIHGKDAKHNVLTIHADNFMFGQLSIEFKNIGQSKSNFDPPYTELKFISVPQHSQYNILNMRSFRGIENCDSSNEMRQFDCVNEFIASRLECTMPSLATTDTKAWPKKCSTAEELDLFYKIDMDILMHNLDEELRDFGCLVQNCIRNTWTTETLVTINQDTIKNNPFFEHLLVENKTSFWFSVLSNEVEVTEEYLLYGIDSFIADVGGFLGLLLGASLLSLVEDIIECVQKPCCGTKTTDA